MGTREIIQVPRVSCCSVDAHGVPAEWIEATAATDGQPTIVSFRDPGEPADSASPAPSLAAKLAIATGARVLEVGFRRPAAVDDGIRTWLWLLGEGCDASTTAFIGFSHKGARACRVFCAAKQRGLPLPSGGAWFAWSIVDHPIAVGRADLHSLLIGVGASQLLGPSSVAGSAIRLTS